MVSLSTPVDERETLELYSGAGEKEVFLFSRYISTRNLEACSSILSPNKHLEDINVRDN
jgi:hypothetical protein